MAQINMNPAYMAFPSSIKRGVAAALDTTAVWYDYDLMVAYAKGGQDAIDAGVAVTAYVGQNLTYVDKDNNTATVYVIADTNGTLNEVGTATLGDDQSIELNDGVLSLKDFGKRYYKYVAEVTDPETQEVTAAHYELVEVDETNKWAAGLEPKVVLEGENLVLGWYEPNPTTVDGVQDQVVAVQGEIAQAKEEITELDEILNGTEENPGGLVADVENINEALYGVDGETPVPGLIEEVEELRTDVDNLNDTLSKDYYKKTETYSKTEVDGLVSGVFHFEGTKESYSELPTQDNTKGDVYQVGDKEYAWNGTEWVELGYVIDLSSYYTKTEVNAEIKKVQDEVDAAEGLISDNADAIDDLEGRVATLEEAKEGFDSHFETVDGDIEGLKSADEGFETRIGTLEKNIGTPSTLESALFPAVEALQKRIDGLVEVGGEANLINGLTINGTALVPNAERIVELPSFAGATAGLVPAVTATLDNTYFLNALGEWSVPMDSRIGDLGDYSTVTEYVDGMLGAALTWSSIAE